MSVINTRQIDLTVTARNRLVFVENIRIAIASMAGRHFEAVVIAKNPIQRFFQQRA